MTCNRRNPYSAICFFKIITAPILEAGKLKLPNGFTRKHGGDVSNPLFLKPPDDQEWKIHWTKEDGYIWFQKGWKEFASHYSLDHGHLVLFQYKTVTPSNFEVHIFDKSTLEIEYPSHGNNDEPDNLDQINDDSVQILNKRTSCKKRRLKSPISCPQPSQKLRNGTSENVGRSYKLPKLPPNVNDNQPQGTEFGNLDENVGGGSLECPKGKKLTSKNPSFKVVMIPSSVKNSLHVPFEFSKKHLKNKKSDIILHDIDGKTWHVKYLLGRSRIGAGWGKFASDNNLKVGDICVFELTKSRPLSFKVLIFPPGGESDQPHSPSPQESLQGDIGNSLDPAARIIDLESETSITRKGRKATQSTSKPIIHRTFTNEALKQAKKFIPENPYFTVNIKPNNWGDYRQDVRSAFVSKYLNNKQHLIFQFGEEFWPVELWHYPRHGSAKLSKGWARFARETNLVVGDVCVFELINSEEDAVPVLHVHIFRGKS